MGRRVLNRKEMRNDFDAAERRKEDEVEEEVDDDEEDDDDEEEEAGEETGEPAEEAEESDEDDEAGDDDDDEDAPKKKKKKVKVAAPKPKAKPRTRSAKVVRKRIVWVVFNNSQQKVATFDYAKRADAEAHAAKLMADKRSTHFIQPVKEDIVEEKKEK